MKGEAAGQNVRVVVAFFAALVGFGLKALLDRPIPHAGPLAFLAAIALVLRFLLGAANHLWYEHVRQDHAGNKAGYALDLASLVTLGVLAAMMCYSTSAASFLMFAAAIPFSGIVWQFVNAGLGRSQSEWSFWFLINIIHTITLLVALAAIELPRFGIGPLSFLGWTPSVTLAWWFVLAVAVVMLCWDYWKQLGVIDSA